MYYHLTRVSRNTKTGPIPVSTSSRDTCPDSCPLKRNGCYADSGPLSIHWNAITTQQRGESFENFLRQIRALPKRQLWRYAQAGDLPGVGDRINRKQLHQLVKANAKRAGFTFTHKPLSQINLNAIREAIQEGFVINMSADNLEAADRYFDLKLPTATVLPRKSPNVTLTPKGRKVVVCPAYTKNLTCDKCRLCANPDRSYIIGFPAHGTQAKKAEEVFYRATPV